MNRWRKLLLLSVSISIIVIISIMLLTIDAESLKYLARTSPLFIISALLLHLSSILAVSLKLKLLTRSIGYHLSLKKAIEITFASGFLAALTPSQVGGEPLRVKMLAEETGGGNATAVVFGERVMDVLFFVFTVPVIVVLFGGMGMMRNPWEYVIGGSIFIVLIWSVIWIGVIKPHIMKVMVKKLFLSFMRFSRKKDVNKLEKTLLKIEEEIDNFSISFRQMVRKKGYFASALLLTALLWVLDFSIPSILLIGFGLPPIWVYSIFAQILITLIALIPISPGASGVYEISIFGLYSPYVPRAVIGVFILQWRLATYYTNLVGGGIISMNILKKQGKDDNGG